MIYGYIRVSTDKQSLGNQAFEINQFCRKHNLRVNCWAKEVISGATNYEKRKLGLVLAKLKKGDILICTEISRLGRNLLQIMGILNTCIQRGAQVWTLKDNFRLGVDIQSKVIAFAFSLSAEIERNLISQRTREALARIKSEGRVLGRKKGSKNRCHLLDGKKSEIARLYNEGWSTSRLSRFYNVSRSTMRNFLSRDLRAASRALLAIGGLLALGYS